MKEEGDYESRKEELIKALEGLTITDCSGSGNGNNAGINNKNVKQLERDKKIIMNEKESFNFIDYFLSDIDSKEEFISEVELNKEIEVNELKSQNSSHNIVSQQSTITENNNNNNADMVIDKEYHTPTSSIFKKGKKNKKTIDISED